MKTLTNIRKESIQKTTDFLSEINYLLGETKTLTADKIKEISSRHKVSGDILGFACRGEGI